ncbi:hypothetical protein DLAC_06530 [Tieghemostelium lacteum]|uniref:Uncharacterized protein n=1 Tax=Tieghemostelium lacteum TaxID=361077 RepID=A0A151ZEZ9_TIELA|nr:hypothetical protein DLAC_06530 [Tieghemostelium lacteum]|eukprot:KYQ92538.1 hypothetical protein DLAC_06530 [Tieghemostelium lacteum]
MGVVQLQRYLVIKIFDYLYSNYKNVKICKLIAWLCRDYRDNVAPLFKYRYSISGAYAIEPLAKETQMSLVDLNVNLSVDFKKLVNRYPLNWVDSISSLYIETQNHLQIQDFGKMKNLKKIYISGVNLSSFNLLDGVSKDVTAEFIEPVESLDFSIQMFMLPPDLSIVSKVFQQSRQIKELILRSNKVIKAEDNKIFQFPNLTSLVINKIILEPKDIGEIIKSHYNLLNLVLEITNTDILDSISTSRSLKNLHLQKSSYKEVFELPVHNLIQFINSTTILKSLKIGEGIEIRNNTNEALQPIHNQSLHSLFIMQPLKNLLQKDYFFDFPSIWETPKLGYMTLTDYSNVYHFSCLHSLVYVSPPDGLLGICKIMEMNMPNLRNLFILNKVGPNLSTDHVDQLYQSLSKNTYLEYLHLSVHSKLESICDFIESNHKSLRSFVFSTISNIGPSPVEFVAYAMKKNTNIQKLWCTDFSPVLRLTEYIEAVKSLLCHQPITSLNVGAYNCPSIDTLFESLQQCIKDNLNHISTLEFRGIPLGSKLQEFLNRNLLTSKDSPLPFL